MYTFSFFRCTLLVIAILFFSIASAQTPTTPQTPHHHGGHHGKRGHHRRNAAKFFGFSRSRDPNQVHNQTYQANEFLHAHNWVRTQYKLPNLSWDENLAGYARQYLTQHRSQDCKLIHSTASYGENMFWGKKLHWTPSDAVYYWYIEKDSFDFKTLKCAPPPKMCGHFTQLVWRDSTRVGCALHHCSVAGAGLLIACEYDPPGNYENENPLEAHEN